jgi:hypothetical protein
VRCRLSDQPDSDVRWSWTVLEYFTEITTVQSIQAEYHVDGITGRLEMKDQK